MKVKLIILLSFLTTVFLLLNACQMKAKESYEHRKIKVVTSLFPLYDFAKNIGREKTEVSLLLPPGIEAHSFEPKPGDIVKINEANLFIYTGEFMEPWVDDIVKAIGKGPLIINASKGIYFEYRNSNGHRFHHDKSVTDPHIWLDFFYAQKMVDNILEGFINSDPGHEDYYRRNADVLKKRLIELDKRFMESLKSCKKDTIIHGGHFAFGYLAKRYNLKYLTAYKEFSPDAEPAPKDLIELINTINKNNVKFIFYEELINPKLSETISKETGAKLLMLHGAHNVTKDEINRGVTFISMMEQNLKNLKIGLECE